MLHNELTVIIPCKNEENYIGNLLHDLNNQIGIDGVKVIIADNFSTDSTRDIIDNCRYSCPRLDIQVIQGGTVSVGRNNGAKLANTPYICFIDADTKLFSSDIIFKSYQSVLVGYNLVTCKVKSYADSLVSKIAFLGYNLVNSVLSRKYPFAIGAYFFVNRKRFMEHGMFNETTNHSEDFLFSQNFAPMEFKILDRYIGQDDRRFRKMGYLNMLRYLIVNLYKYLRKDLNHFRKDVGYWN